jgi:Uma2 family endonuclease
MTTAEYFNTPERTLPSELAFGELRVADAPSAPHQRIVRELLLALAADVEHRQAGEVLCAPVDVVLDFAANLVVQPDLLFVSESRREIVRDRIYGAPDLVVEVLSPAPRVGRLEERVGWFARYGVRECWLVSQPEKQIVVLTLSDRGVVGRAAFSGNQPILSEVLPGTRVTPYRAFGY